MSGNNIQQWDINGCKISPTHNGSYVTFSSDGTKFASCHEAAVIVQNSDSGATVTKFYIANDGVNYCCFSPDNSLIAVAGYCAIYVWDITNLEPHIVETFVGYPRDITSLAFSSSSSLISSCHDKSVKFWQIAISFTNPAISDPKSTPLALVPIVSITLQGKDGVVISGDMNGMVRVWDIITGLCKISLQTPVRDHKDVKFVNNRLILVWQVGEELYIQSKEEGKDLEPVKTPLEDVEDIRISGDGSNIFCLHYQSIQALSIEKGQVVGKVEVGPSHSKRWLTVDGSRVWIHPSTLYPQGWDFGICGLFPTPLPNMLLPHLKDTKPWDFHQPRIKDKVTGKVIFELAGRFAKPVNSQWDSQYLVAGYGSGEVLILDLSCMLLNKHL